MRRNFLLVWALMLSAGVWAQPVTNAPPAAPIAAPGAAATTNATPATSVAPATNAAAVTNSAKAKAKKAKAKQAEKKSATKPKESAAEPVTTPLVVGKATVVASNVNVRGQAKLNSEVITKLQKGDTVDVLEEIRLKR